MWGPVEAVEWNPQQQTGRVVDHSDIHLPRQPRRMRDVEKLFQLGAMWRFDSLAANEICDGVPIDEVVLEEGFGVMKSPEERMTLMEAACDSAAPRNAWTIGSLATLP